jgi:selenophosphate synthase
MQSLIAKIEDFKSLKASFKLILTSPLGYGSILDKRAKKTLIEESKQI